MIKGTQQESARKTNKMAAEDSLEAEEEILVICEDV